MSERDWLKFYNRREYYINDQRDWLNALDRGLTDPDFFLLFSPPPVPISTKWKTSYDKNNESNEKSKNKKTMEN